MFGLVAILRVKPEELDRMVEVVTRLKAAVAQAEPGTLQYDFFRDRKEPTQFVVMERYESAEAMEAHGAGVVGELLSELFGMLSGPPVLHRLEFVA